jgi:transposase, IS6 family
MTDLKGRHFEGEIVLWAVRWYCGYGVSYQSTNGTSAGVRSA